MSFETEARKITLTSLCAVDCYLSNQFICRKTPQLLKNTRMAKDKHSINREQSQKYTQLRTKARTKTLCIELFADWANARLTCLSLLEPLIQLFLRRDDGYFG